MPVRVLYVIGELSPTSIPLEVAQHIENGQIQLRIAAYYESIYDTESLHCNVSRLASRSRLDPHGIRRLHRCIFEFRPHVIHVHHTVSAFWSTLFGKLIGAKVIRTEHSNAHFHTAARKIPNTVSRLLSDLVICNSENTYRSLSTFQKCLVSERWRVVYNGINVERIDRAASYVPPFEREKEMVTVGSVGRLIEQKNYSRLVEAFAQMRSESEQEVRLIIVGDGNEQESLERKVDRLGLTNCVTFTGRVGRDEVYAALHEFDFFVMPTLGEGFCNAVVEAMAAGLPTVCSDIPTLREVAGDAAVYADPTDPSHISSVLLQLLREDRESSKKRGENARKWATERYSVQRTAKQYAQAYHQVGGGE